MEQRGEIGRREMGNGETDGWTDGWTDGGMDGWKGVEKARKEGTRKGH